jgi:hypothetical protein
MLFHGKSSNFTRIPLGITNFLFQPRFWINFNYSQPFFIYTPVFLYISPPNIIYYLICHQIFQKHRFRHLNFNHSYLFNRNSESGDSCAKILRITSCISSSYLYSYYFAICLIVCLSVRRICFQADEWRLQDQVYLDLKTKYTRTLIFSFQSNETSVLDACCTYFLYLSIGFHASNLCQNCGNIYVSYLSMYYPCYPGFG